MSLASAERRRLFGRRAVRIMLLGSLLVLTGIAVTFTVVSKPHDAAAIAAAERQAQADYDQSRAGYEHFVAECNAAKDRNGGVVDEKFWPPDCAMGGGPQREEFRAENYLPYRFNFAREFHYLIIVFGAVLMLAAFVIGATFVGAEWHSGNMMNLLLWRPRRVPTLLTKLGVLLGGMLGVTVVLGALWTGAFWLMGRYDGTQGTLTADAWRSFGLDGARAAALVLVAAAVGFALASIGRHTAMALGVVVGVALVSEVGVAIVASLLGAHFYQKWQLSTYVTAWLNKKITYSDFSSCDWSQGMCEPIRRSVTWQTSAWVFGVTIVVLVGAALWSMRRRDVT
jgi:ABC-type transport system involved in multi-copper enzyme maturation permease subunit